ncbi:MAG TPA: gephyrin-like molybdotransferase Glp [Terriglobales bacterium]|nr:gephyrin-like molybdotransferase Glp [Terriglobales bacterium]
MNSSSRLNIERVVTFEGARQIVLDQARQVHGDMSGREEEVPLLESLGRTLAKDIHADRDFPPFPRATRDGYAVRSEDVSQPPVELNLIGEVRAGGSLPEGFGELSSGQAIAIMTGAPVPAGSDAVVMVEHTERHGNSVCLLRSAQAGENVVVQGSEGVAGSVLISSGTLMGAAQIALAAAVGKARVRVQRRPVVAILSTGDEVVPISAMPASNQIRNSNSFSLVAQVIAAGGEPRQLPIAPDEPNRLRELIAEGLESDLLLLSGGVSAGEYDLVEPALSEFSAEFFFTGVQMQPGKPLVFGRATAKSGRRTYFFGLPGNPISTMVTFRLFANIIVAALCGNRQETTRFLQARLAADLKTKTGLTRFLPARLIGDLFQPEVELVKWQGSGDMASFARADCLLVVPPDQEQFHAGETVSVFCI